MSGKYAVLSFLDFVFRFSFFLFLSFFLSFFSSLWGIWFAAVDALEAADKITAGMVEGGFMLRSEYIGRVTNLDSKPKNHREYVLDLVSSHCAVKRSER
jgi:hypothetical protein